MGNFDKGGALAASDGLAQTDPISPISITATQPLVTFTDMMSIVDTTSGNVVLTLPAASASLNAMFTIKRIDDSTNTLDILPDGSDTIDDGSSYLLGNKNEFVSIISNGVDGWHILGSRTFAVGAINKTGVNTTQSVTGIFAVADGWDNNSFTTPGRIDADQTNNKISVLDIRDAVQDTYQINFSSTVQYANNVDVDLAFFIDGVETSSGARFTGKGSNDIHVSFEGILPVLVSGGTPQDIDVRVKADSDNTITWVSGGVFTAQRLGG